MMYFRSLHRKSYIAHPTFPFARFLAIKIFIGLLLLTGCATAPRIVPRFVAPSTAPISAASARIAQKQIETRQHIQKAQEIVRTLTLTLPEDKLKVDALSAELGKAQESNDQLKDENGGLIRANDFLRDQITKQTGECNTVASDYNKEVARNQSLEQSRHGWVKRFWIATAIATALLAWTFRKPLLLLAGL